VTQYFKGGGVCMSIRKTAQGTRNVKLDCPMATEDFTLWNRAEA